MLNKCQNCTSNKNLLIFNRTKGNLMAPKAFCLDCVVLVLKAIAPDTFPVSIKPDIQVVTELINADAQTYEKVHEILSSAAPKKSKPSLKLVKSDDRFSRVGDKNGKGMVTENSSPKELYSYLDQHIMGQEDAKKKLALAINRKQMAEANHGISKINLLLVGPTASGKTELCRIASNILKAPFVKIDCSHLTPSGYKGVNVENILLRLYEAAERDIKTAERGIVLLDEFDKLVTQSPEFAMRVQQELLKIVEGGDISFEVEKGRAPITMNTDRVLFIAAGSFPGIERIVNPKKSNIRLAGTVVTPDMEGPKMIESRHLISFGLIPELVGRFTHTAQLHKLTVNELFDILCKKKNNLKAEYESIFLMMDKEVTFSHEFMMSIAEKAAKSETGARSLRFLMEEALKDYLFNQTDLPESITGKRNMDKMAA